MNQVNSIEQFIETIEKKFGGYEEKYFRGQLEKYTSITPSITRDAGFKANESRMYNETLEQRADDFLELASPLERMSKMQHYGIPTRLIDVTINPLIALYFAVEDIDCTSHGNVLIYIREGHDFSSEHARALSLLATTDSPTLKSISAMFTEEYGSSIANDDLIRYIDTPIFVKHCDDLKKSNNRLYEQEGAFFLCSNTLIGGTISGELKSLDSIPPSMVIRVPYEYKSQIKTELDEKHGINTTMIYPELPSFSLYLREKYKQKGISLDDKYEIVETRQSSIPNVRRWSEFFITLKTDDSDEKACGRKCQKCQTKQLSIVDIRRIVNIIISKHQQHNEVISVFVANCNDDYVSTNWIIRAQWVSPKLHDSFKPYPSKEKGINNITWHENNEYSIRSDFNKEHYFERDINLFVYHFKAYETFKSAYTKIKHAYDNVSFDEFLGVVEEYENIISKCYKDFGNFGRSRTKEFNDFLENFIAASIIADNWKFYRTSEKYTIQALKRIIDIGVSDIERHIIIIEKCLPEWRARIGVTETDIESIVFVEKGKSKFTHLQTIPVRKDAIDVYFNEFVAVLPDKKIRISGSTNLFDNANLMLTIKGENNYSAQNKALVTGGKFEFEVFSNKGFGLDAGMYTAQITLPISGTQSRDFVKFAGAEYENLTGQYVKRGSIAPSVEYSFNFSVE